MFTRGTAFADIRISGIIPREIIFWYWEIINFSVSGIDFSPLQSGNHSDEIRTALWRARPNCQLALPPVSLMGNTNTPFRWYSLAIRKSGRISSWKRRIENGGCQHVVSDDFIKNAFVLTWLAVCGTDLHGHRINKTLLCDTMEVSMIRLPWLAIAQHVFPPAFHR